MQSLCSSATTISTPSARNLFLLQHRRRGHYALAGISALDQPCLHLSARKCRGPKNLIVANVYPESSSSRDMEEWLSKLPHKNKPLYSHSLPCIEAWLISMGFYQSKDDLAVWFVEKSGWHAQLSMDIRELHIKYLKTGPGNLERDVERKFSYALSREDLENAILGGP